MYLFEKIANLHKRSVLLNLFFLVVFVFGSSLGVISYMKSKLPEGSLEPLQKEVKKIQKNTADTISRGEGVMKRMEGKLHYCIEQERIRRKQTIFFFGVVVVLLCFIICIITYMIFK